MISDQFLSRLPKKGQLANDTQPSPPTQNRPAKDDTRAYPSRATRSDFKTRPSGREVFGRQRQAKGKPLERIEGRVKPETAEWLRKLAGDSSIGIALDYLRASLSTHSDGTK